MDYRESPATIILRYMPQKRPTMPPTITRRWTGMKAKFSSETSGQSFNPARAMGQKFC